MKQDSAFSTNLRMKCAAYGTIAQFCRATGINRQQFNKYLAGSNLPNAITLRKICKTLGVKEEALFDPGDLGVEGKRGLRDTDGANALRHLGFGSTVQELDFSPGFIRPGFYFCYFELGSKKHTLLKCLIQVKSMGGLTYFKRLTYMRHPNQPGKMVVIGRHRGLLCASGLEAHFFGVDRIPPHQVTLMSIVKPIDFQIGLIGVTLTRLYTSSRSVRTILVPVPKALSIHDALRSLGYVELSETDLEIQLLSASNREN